MKTKKGDTSIGFIVALSLGLLIIIIGAIMVLSRAGMFGTGLSQCKGEGKFCTQDVATCDASGGAATPTKNCNDDEDTDSEGNYCCVKIS